MYNILYNIPIFDNVGLSYVWNQQNPIHLVELKLTVKQKLTDQFIQKWYNLRTLPISPYGIKLGILVLILKIFLQNCKCIFSNTCTFSYPQISHPYVRMGSMRVSNSNLLAQIYYVTKVNLNKTKVVILCKRKSRQIQSFKLFGHDLDIVESYSYLGVT
jgi:hypothetical protein